MIIFLYGEDSFRSSQKLAELKNKFLQSDKIGAGLSIFDFGGKNESARKLLDVLEMPNLLSPKRLAIVKRIVGSPEAEEILKFLEKNKKNILEDNDLIAVFWEEGIPKKSDKLGKFLDANSKKQNFEKMQGLKLSQWAVKRIKELDEKAGITRPALEKLVAYTGGNMHVLDKEIQKLVNYKNGGLIKEEDAELLVKADIDANIFNTIDALANRNKKTALKFFHQHLENGDDPFYIFSMFVYQFRNLVKVADLKDSGMDENQIGKVSKLHPFVVKKSLGQIRNFSLEKLKETYKKLLKIDTEVKTGKIDIKLALDKFIVEL